MIAAAAKKHEIPVTKRALLQRINRKLAHDLQKVYACRSDNAYAELGDFYRTDLNRNAVVEKHVDLEELGRELEVLKPWEALEK